MFGLIRLQRGDGAASSAAAESLPAASQSNPTHTDLDDALNKRQGSDPKICKSFPIPVSPTSPSSSIESAGNDLTAGPTSPCSPHFDASDASMSAGHVFDGMYSDSDSDMPDLLLEPRNLVCDSDSDISSMPALCCEESADDDDDDLSDHHQLSEMPHLVVERQLGELHPFLHTQDPAGSYSSDDADSCASMPGLTLDTMNNEAYDTGLIAEQMALYDDVGALPSGLTAQAPSSPYTSGPFSEVHRMAVALAEIEEGQALSDESLVQRGHATILEIQMRVAADAERQLLADTESRQPQARPALVREDSLSEDDEWEEEADVPMDYHAFGSPELSLQLERTRDGDGDDDNDEPPPLLLEQAQPTTVWRMGWGRGTQGLDGLGFAPGALPGGLGAGGLGQEEAYAEDDENEDDMVSLIREDEAFGWDSGEESSGVHSLPGLVAVSDDDEDEDEDDVPSLVPELQWDAELGVAVQEQGAGRVVLGRGRGGAQHVVRYGGPGLPGWAAAAALARGVGGQGAGGGAGAGAAGEEVDEDEEYGEDDDEGDWEDWTDEEDEVEGANMGLLENVFQRDPAMRDRVWRPTPAVTTLRDPLRLASDIRRSMPAAAQDGAAPVGMGQGLGGLGGGGDVLEEMDRMMLEPMSSLQTALQEMMRVWEPSAPPQPFDDPPEEEPEDGQEVGECWVCYRRGTEAHFVTPCTSCAGSLRYIHRSCFERWLTTSHSRNCPNCRRSYPTEVLQQSEAGRCALQGPAAPRSFMDLIQLGAGPLRLSELGPLLFTTVSARRPPPPERVGPSALRHGR